MRKNNILIHFLRDFIKVLVISFLVFGVYVLIARLLFHVPTVEHSKLMAAKQKASTYLSENIDKFSTDYQGLTGIKFVGQGIDAFTIRMMLINNAKNTIDAQYYMWHDDLTGLMMLTAIKDAADRGVRVRMLLDDNAIGGLDPIIAELNQHEMIDIRLYNPFVIRSYKLINFTFDFFRLNRRMHNKVLIADDVAAISGGRNIGDEYFGTGEQAQFMDLDILTVGQVMPAMVDNFNLFYQSEMAIPADLMIELTLNDDETKHLASALKAFDNSEQLKSYNEAIESNQFNQNIEAGQLIDEWTKVTMISDIPSKTKGQYDQSELLIKHLISTLNTAKFKVDVVTPYFVPAEHIEIFTKLAADGIDVRVLTNSFKATDAVAVHAGYARYRHELLAAGVHLFEMKTTQKNSESSQGLTGSSASSLHAKTFAVDDKLVFIGSFNFDPRSTMLNTEMGVLIESEQLAKNVQGYFGDSLSTNSYQLEFNNDKDIIWLETKGNEQTKIYYHDPNTSKLQRLAITLIGYLPIHWLL